MGAKIGRFFKKNKYLPSFFIYLVGKDEWTKVSRQNLEIQKLFLIFAPRKKQ